MIPNTKLRQPISLHVLIIGENDNKLTRMFYYTIVMKHDAHENNLVLVVYVAYYCTLYQKIFSNAG